MITTLISLFYYVIYFVIFFTSEFKNTTINGKTVSCSQFGCKSAFWMALPSLFFIYFHANQIHYKFRLSTEKGDKFFQVLFAIITGFFIYYGIVHCIRKRKGNKSNGKKNGKQGGKNQNGKGKKNGKGNKNANINMNNVAKMIGGLASNFLGGDGGDFDGGDCGGDCGGGE